jgi:hypothetical protein
MKKFLLVLLISMALFLGINNPSNAEEAKKLTANDLRPYMVGLVMYKEPFMGSCSGSVIKNTEEESVVLTASHCLEGDNVVVDVMNKFSTEFYRDTKNDIAFVVFKGKLEGKKEIKFADKVEVWEALHYIGKPRMKEYYTKGTYFDKTPRYFLGTLTIFPGCSGGAVFNSKGEVIGTAIKHYPEHNVSITTHLDDLKWFYKYCKRMGKF